MSLARMTPAPLALALALALGLNGHARADDAAAQAAATQASPSPVQLDTVDVRGRRAGRTDLGGFGEASLLDTPAAVAVIDRQLLDDRQARVLAEVLRNDASSGEAYAPIGYYGNWSIRGYSLNAANSYRIDGMTVVGEQEVALENKQQVQVLKGLSGLQSGVNEPGGLVDYVTKRPEHVRSLTLGTDDQGGRYYAGDWGDWFGPERQFGLRVNAAHEDMRSYVDHADGHRNFLSLAGDWKIAGNQLLQLDVEYQDRAQRSVPGYQLLGGSVVPHDIDVHRLLGYQPWARPVDMAALNAQARYRYSFGDAWSATLAASHSRVAIDDFSAFPWGCYGAASCAGIDVANFFGSDGAYDVSDYRSPGDTRRTDQVKASLEGTFATGAASHQLTAGVDWLHRTVDRHGSINEWVGTAGIDADPPVFAPADDAELGPKVRRLDAVQKALFASDRIGLGEAWQLLLGARQVRYDERVRDRDGAMTRHTRRSDLLPHAALLFKPAADVSLYASFSKAIAPGTEAAWFASNADEILPPTTAYQREIGAHVQRGGVLLGAALFDIRQAYQFAQPQADGSFLYVQQGRLHNRGIELSASGEVADGLTLWTSLAGIRARTEDTGVAAYAGHQALNVPRLRGSVQASWAVPGVEGLALLGGAQYSARKYADRIGEVDVGGYTVYNLGARYAVRLGSVPTTWWLSVDNLTDKFYWRDTGDYLGDVYLFPGAPRSARLSVRFDFD